MRGDRGRETESQEKAVHTEAEAGLRTGPLCVARGPCACVRAGESPSEGVTQPVPSRGGGLCCPVATGVLQARAQTHSEGLTALHAPTTRGGGALGGGPCRPGRGRGSGCVLLRTESFVRSPQRGARGAVSRAAGPRSPGSVGEPLTGFLPATGRAPQVPVLHAVHLPALSALSPGLPQADGPSGRRGQDRVRVRSWLSRACRVVMWR